MALARLALSLPQLPCRSFQKGVLRERSGGPSVAGPARFLPSGGARVGPVSGQRPSATADRQVLNRGNVKAEEPPAEGQLTRGRVEIPVSCYQIIGATEQAEKDEIVKKVMLLKGSEVEDGYTMDAIVARQDLLMDVRDKLLFEQDYAGNPRERIPPRSSLLIPWAWLPGALCLLQEIGEDKLVLEIGRAALHHQHAKPYTHDLILSMSLAELSTAKIAFEKSKVSQGFEALARAQYLLRSKSSFEKMPLLSQIEESLEELAPACTLELLSVPYTSENTERRLGAISALRELLRQGLEVEASCRVSDWPSFLSQAFSKLTAAEIVDLLSWDNLAARRKNKKSIESQNQRVILDYDTFYLSMIAHIAYGFSRRQKDVINKAKAISESLIVSEGVNLKFEEGLCLLLLGQGIDMTIIEKLCSMYTDGGHVTRNSESTSFKEANNNTNPIQLLEMFLKDSVLEVFPDSRGSSPSLVNFFEGPKKLLGSNKIIKGAAKTTSMSDRRSNYNLAHGQRSSEESQQLNSTRHLGEAVKQLAPINMQSQLTVTKDGDTLSGTASPLKRELLMHPKNLWQEWWTTRGFAPKIIYTALVGLVIFSASQLLYVQLGQSRASYILRSGCRKSKTTLASTSCSSECNEGIPTIVARENILERLREILMSFQKQAAYSVEPGAITSISPTGILSSSGHSKIYKRAMGHEDAETLIKKWQAVKAEALGPNHKALMLSQILADPMLSQWQDLTETAKAKSCFWRFVLLKVSIMRADISIDEVGQERAEIEAVLEEAAELVDEFQLKNPNYYSTYKILYRLKRQLDGSWRFCGSDIQS